jgi:hypothetical protein
MKKYLIILSLAFILMVYAWNNNFILYTIASGLDVPSKPYYFITERIFQLPVEANHRLLQHDSLIDLYVHIAGVKRNNNIDLLGLYTAYQHDNNNIGRVYNVVNSMGLMGDETYTFLLESLLNDYEKLNVPVTKYTITRALYLITGKRYFYREAERDMNSGIPITDELYMARQIILNTRLRRRTLKEMVDLDKILRPPGW